MPRLAGLRLPGSERALAEPDAEPGRRRRQEQGQRPAGGGPPAGGRLQAQDQLPPEAQLGRDEVPHRAPVQRARERIEEAARHGPVQDVAREQRRDQVQLAGPDRPEQAGDERLRHAPEVRADQPHRPRPGRAGDPTREAKGEVGAGDPMGGRHRPGRRRPVGQAQDRRLAGRLRHRLGGPVGRAGVPVQDEEARVGEVRVDRLAEAAHDAAGGGGVLVGEDDQQEIEALRPRRADARPPRAAPGQPSPSPVSRRGA